MLEQLPETGAQRKKSAWGGVVSIAVHVAIIGVVVAATAKATPVPMFVHDHTTPVRLAPPPSHGATDRDTRRGQPAGDPPPAVPAVPAVPTVPSFDIPSTVLPPLPATGAATPAAGSDSSLLSAIGAELPNGGVRVSGAGAGVAGDAVVDSPVRTLVDRTPRYPAMLRDAGITGTVRVRFVIDTLGRVEPSSVRVLDSSHELFTKAVVAALRESRFTPGEVAGRRVRTLVERSFRFDIAGGAQ